jgi:hypothetical protein
MAAKDARDFFMQKRKPPWELAGAIHETAITLKEGGNGKDEGRTVDKKQTGLQYSMRDAAAGVQCINGMFITALLLPAATLHASLSRPLAASSNSFSSPSFTAKV